VEAAVVPIRDVLIDEPTSFIEDLKAKASDATVQAIDARFVADLDHLASVIQQAWMADRLGVSRVRFDMDILLRIACDSRVSKALSVVGLKKGRVDVIFVAVGPGEILRSIADYVGRLGEISESLLQLTDEKEKMLRAHHNISDQAIKATLRNRKMSGILAEKAVVALLR
jgi:tRNA threonylcarbamoyladenosine modification (KEOPS) complex Cgi121 subunit